MADYVSLSALLQASASLLLCAPHARLRAESILMFGRRLALDPKLTPARFAAEGVGVALGAFEQLCGLRSLGGEKMGVDGGQAWGRLEWRAETAAPSPIPTLPPTAAESGGSGSGGDPDPAGAAGASPPLLPTATGGAGSGGGGSWITAGYLFLELLSSWDEYLTTTTTAAGKPSGKAGGGQVDSLGLLNSRGAYSAPLTLVHLLGLAAPQQADALLRALLRSEAGGQAELFKWELSMHALVQAGRSPALRRLVYSAQPGYHLLPYLTSPLILAFSKQALARGPLAPRWVGGLVVGLAHGQKYQ